MSGVPEAEIIELKKTEITDRVKESVKQNGQKELNAAKQENQDYEVACVEHEKICGEKAKDFKSLKVKLKQAKKISEEWEKCREDWTCNRSKGAR